MIALLRLVRPLNGVLAALAVFLGGWLAGAAPGDAALWRAALAAGLIASSGYALNDLRDVARDRLNRPRRPLASGETSPGAAVAVVWLAGAGGLALAASAGLGAGLMALGWVLLLGIYEFGLKERMLWGNLLASLVSGSAFLLGGLVAGHPRAALVPACFAFLYHFAREMWKDAADVEGDRATGARTLAVVHGPAGGIRTAAAVFGLLVLLTPLPYLAGLYNAAYLAAVVAGVDLLLVVVVAVALVHPTRAVASRTQGVLKLGMAAGLCALALGRL